MGYEGNDKAALRSIANRNLTKSMQTLFGICSGIVADNHINDNEIFFLKTWLNDYQDVAEIWPGSAIYARVINVLNDGIITNEERENLLHALKEITGNYFTDTGAAQAEITGIPFDIVPVVFAQNIFCFTGEFIAGTRAYCRKITEQVGAETIDNMTKKVNYLVIGTMNSPAWIQESYGHKIAYAIELKNKDHPVLIVTEKHWNNSLQAVSSNSGLPSFS